MLELKEETLQIHRTPITDKQILGWGAIVIFQAFVLGGVWFNLSKSVENAASKSEVERISDQVMDMRNAVSPLPTLQLQISQVTQANAENKARIEEIGARLDKFIEAIGGKLDNINENVNGVKIDIRVLSQRVDNAIGERSKPAAYFPRASTR
ncbi:hypothetical protein HMSP1_53 [Sinorhizobium phage HMSP1-Susan]|nr:hypothetical protein HMSP1_53 [Sinorhizobium phage HMSP1-Susan]